MNCSLRLGLLLVLVFTCSGRAATPGEDPAHDALRQIKATYETAIRTGDLSPLRPLFATETTAIMLLGHEVKSFAELEQHWKYVRGLIGPGGSYTTTLKPEPSLIFGDVALSRGTSDEVVKTGTGKEFAFTSQWTAVSRRVNGEWKVLRLHGSMDPVTNVFTTTFLQQARLSYGGGGLLVGALLGAGVVLFLKKRSATA